jgi:hypothetical protein
MIARRARTPTSTGAAGGLGGALPAPFDAAGTAPPALRSIAMIRCTLALTVALSACGKSDISRLELSRRELARSVVEDYAEEGYPVWAMGRQNKGCPSIADLDEALFRQGPNKDPWGRPYRILCGAELPAGAYGIGVYSVGADGKDRTDDDIKSWWMAESAAERGR